MFTKKIIRNAMEVEKVITENICCNGANKKVCVPSINENFVDYTLCKTDC